MEHERRVRMVFYRDVEMSADWPDAIRRAQSIHFYTIEGRQYRRVRYGRERPSWQAERQACHDCADKTRELSTGTAPTGDQDGLDLAPVALAT